MARYVLVEIYPEDLVEKTVRKILENYEKIVGINIIKGGVHVICIESSRVIFGVRTRFLKYLRTAILMTRSVDGKDVLVLTLRVSGTLRKCKAQLKSIQRIVSS